MIILGEFHDTEIDLDVIFIMEKFCGGSSGAETQIQYKIKTLLFKINIKLKLAWFASFFHT